VRLHVAALPRQDVLDQREARLAADIRRCERVAAPAVAGDAGSGHGLQAAAVEIDGELTRAVFRGEVVVLGELDGGIAVGRVETRDARRRAPFDGVGADVPLGVAPDRRFDVELARVVGARIGRD